MLHPLSKPFKPSTRADLYTPLLLLTLLLSAGSAEAARLPWCMRVVPSGQLVTRYGSYWCRQPAIDRTSIWGEATSGSA